MKHSNFTNIKIHRNFKAGFQGALALIIAEIIDWFTEKDVNGNYKRNKDVIDAWDNARVNFAYSLKGKDGEVIKYIDDLRPLFPVNEIVSDNKYAPFTLMDDPLNQNPNGIPDIDDVETILYQRIKAGGYINYWAGATPEMVDNTKTGGTMRQ